MAQISHQKYFEQAKKNPEYALLLNAAEQLAKEQRATKIKFSSKKLKGDADVMLDNVSRYRKRGKFKSLYHANLYKKIKEGGVGCPVVDISIKQLDQDIFNKAYFSKMNSESKNFRIKKRRLNLLNFNNAYSVFVNDYLLPAFLGKEQEYILDEINTPVVKTLVSYFTRQEDCKIKLHKGICLFGNIGTGKSTIMREMARFTKDMKLETEFHFVTMNEVYSNCDSKGLESLDKYKFRTCAFDDIGMRADNNINNFGTKINAYQELVQRQYNRYTRPNPSLSHYTTNVPYNVKDKETISKLCKAFGARELDRFREMSNFISLNGSSRRRY